MIILHLLTNEPSEVYVHFPDRVFGESGRIWPQASKYRILSLTQRELRALGRDWHKCMNHKTMIEADGSEDSEG